MSYARLSEEHRISLPAYTRFGDSSVWSSPWYVLIAFIFENTSDTLYQVALERVKEYSELPLEPPEFIEPRPAPSWPEKGQIECNDLVIRYAVSISSLHSVMMRL